MTTYYKAVRLDGTDFYTRTINYAAALESGEIIRHPSRHKTRNDSSTYLSVSVEPADCTGFRWPCRLFRVEPVGRAMASLLVSPNKRAVSALRVVEELPAHMVFGPNGEAVATLIERASRLTRDEASRLAAARSAAWDAAWYYSAWDAAWAAARYAAWDAAWAAARYATSDAAVAILRAGTGGAAWDAAVATLWAGTGDAASDAAVAALWAGTGGAAWDAAVALMMRDKITPEQFDLLYGSWASVIDK